MMWDLDPEHSGQTRPTSRRSASPAFPSPYYANATPTSAIYPGSYPSQMPMPVISSSPGIANGTSVPQYYSQQQISGTEGVTSSPYQIPPQVIIIKHSHKRHHGSDGRHRRHSHSHSSQPIVLPQPVSYSNSHPAPYYPSPIPYDIPQGQHNSDSHHHSTGPIGDIQHTIPHQQSSRPVAAVPPKPHTHGIFSNCTGRKKALCIGINYRGQSHELRGCINDARSVRKWLIKDHGFRNEDVVLLTDDTTEPRHLPTRKNMIDAMKCIQPDGSYIQDSGHGGQAEDQNGDETDGFDEVIFPLDFKDKGHIVDDVGLEISNDNLSKISHRNYTKSWSPNFQRAAGSRGPVRKRKETHGDAISWSACQDGKTSVDTFKDGVAVGAMSHAFISSLRERPDQSYGELLRSLRLLLGPKYNQVPQLGTAYHMDIGRKFVI
ncbi:hypothetical protein NP233_g2555 [Leucocoprinus birnbaumii]|uniref:Peptidase C14 caspase domain-containing protein n=1 Tax=Leucocoprinus birnbaumii TaxID=56174 RepID=A0AAD5YUS7_9AGAR|nr:hypothetical protein NP233_g2555 [Leucocoprinus birnbaumii]